MCGICGVMYAPTGPDLDYEPAPVEAAGIMLRDMIHRGRDATGWMYPDTNAVTMYRIAAPADRVQIEVPDDVQWLAGHVRMATHGSPRNMANNHPIAHRHVIGVHNGIIRNHRTILEQTGRDDPTAEVDSEALFAAIARHGARRGLERVRGDFATAWVDTRWHAAQLYLARNYGRPLWIGHADTGATYFASERETLKALGVGFTALYPFKMGTYAALTPMGFKWTRHFLAAPPLRRATRGAWGEPLPTGPKGGGKGTGTKRVPGPAKPRAAKPVASRKRNPDRPWYLQDEFEFPVKVTNIRDRDRKEADKA
jgi:asparagine synthetase B (glutamine-hydrolysing)